MYRSKHYRIAIALAVLSAPVLAGCGSAGTAVNNGGVGGGGGWNNGYYWGTGSCQPISSAVSFSMQNVYVDSANIVGGNFPYSGQSVGQVMVGTGGFTQGMGTTYSRSSYDGTLSLNLVSAYQQQWTPYSTYPQNTLPYGQGAGYNPYYNNYGMNTNMVSGQGMLQISPTTQQEIYYSVMSGQIQVPGYNMGGSYYGVPGAWNPYQVPSSYAPPPGGYGMGQQICVSSIAMNLGRWGTTLYGGKLYVYLNNTSHGIVLSF